jgi:hypothetical protein
MLETLRRYILKALKPFNKVLGHIYLAPKYRDIKHAHVLKLEDNLQPGDVLLSFSKGELTNWLIDGEYKHCAMYVGAGEVVEAVGHGVITCDIEDFCATKDKIAVVRPTFCTGEEAFEAVKIALLQKGKDYDYYFEPSEQSFYCAELIAYSYQVATKFTSPFVAREVMGIKTVLPSDFKLAATKFQVVIEVP